MAVVNLFQESLDQRGFYTPQFEVRIKGAQIPNDVLRDVLQLTYKDSVKELDSFELTINNWDPLTNDFKYVGAETAESLKGDTSESRRYHLFEPCNKEVEIRMGYTSDMRVMLTGNFTTMEPNFTSGGAPTLNVRGLNVLHRLRSKQYVNVWENKKDSAIAKEIEKLIDKETRKKRFPLPIEIDPNALSSQNEPEITYVAQQNQYDIDFLLARARQRGYVIFIQEEDPNVRGSKQRLYFGPSHEGEIPGLRDVTFELEWGKSLMDFKPTLTTANQVRSVTVKGWNRRTRKPIAEKATLDEIKVNRDLDELLKKCEPRDEIVTGESVFTQLQARDRAKAILTERQKEMVKASATTVGLPDLRAGQRVQIAGVGSRFSGTYFITDTTHTIGDAGYTTKFNARREDEGGAK